MWAFLLGVVALAVVSYVDDLRDLPSWLRMAVQVAAVLLVFLSFPLQLELWKAMLVCIGFVGVLNIYNFMDGVNGMLALYSLSVLLSLLYLNNFDGPFVDNDLLLTLLVADLVFAFFNCRRCALCFSGDVGSIVMGFAVLYLMLRYVLSLPQDGVSVSVLTLVVVYLADGGLTILKRFLAGKNVFKPHREHLYETLANDLKVPHLRISLIYAVLQLAINVGYIFVPDRNLYFFVCVLSLLLAYGLFFFFYGRNKEEAE